MGGWLLSAIRRAVLSALTGATVSVLSLSLLALALASALADPVFYVDRLRNADAYDLVLDRTVAPAVESAMGGEGEGESVAGIDARAVVSAIRRALPQRWVYRELETQIAGPLGYLAGDRSRFVFRLSVKDRIPAIIAETRRLAVDADAQAFLLDEVMSAPLANAASEFDRYGLELSEDRLKESVRIVLDEEWLDARLAEIINEAGPYVAGEADSFEIVISLDEPLAAAESEVARLVAEVDWYGNALDGFVASYVDESLKDVDRTLGGFTIDRDDILGIIRSSVTPEMAEPVIADAAAQMTRYLLGKSDTVAVSFDLTEAKRIASPQIGAIAESLVTARTLTIANCAPGSENLTLDFAGARMPFCIPAEEPARSEARARLSAARGEAGDAFIRTVLGPLPDQMAFTQDDLREQLRLNAGAGALDIVDSLRSAAKDGVRYTDENLESDLAALYGSYAVTQLRSAQDFLQNGWSFDQSDMRAALPPDIIDLTRRWFPVARVAGYGGIALSALFALLAGLIRGDSALSRLLWACVFFTLAAAVSWTMNGIIFPYLLEDRLEGALYNLARANNIPDDAVPGLPLRALIGVGVDALSDVRGRAAFSGAICLAAGGTLALLLFIAKPRPPKPRQSDAQPDSVNG